MWDCGITSGWGFYLHPYSLLGSVRGELQKLRFHAINAAVGVPGAFDACLRLDPALLTASACMDAFASPKLRVGGGVAVKRDLTSGVNLYAGWSSLIGKLTVSSQVDALRRLTCSAVGSVVLTDACSLDVAMRLKLNTITFQNTAVEIGGALPIPVLRGAYLRLSVTPSGTIFGVTASDWVKNKRLLNGAGVDFSAGLWIGEGTHGFFNASFS
jgi:hypothetical protein